MTAAALTPTPATTARVALPSAAALALARTRLELLQFFRERDAVIFIFAYPIIMLAIFATVFADQEIDFGPSGTLDVATYFLPGMIAKLGVDDRTRAVTVALERGILQSP